MGAEHRFIKACRREPTDCTPIWLMRQAGRYMANYRAIRAENTFLEVSKTPTLCAEVTMQPIRAFDIDAAIIFADIMTPLEGIGIDYDIAPGIGPVIDDPVNSLKRLKGLKEIDPKRDVDFLMTAIERVVAELDGHAPLIGFAGAPFTLACYCIEGRGSRGFNEARRVMYAEPELWDGLMSRLSRMVTSYLLAQHHAGAEVLQLFDSWVGLLSPQTYREKVLPYTQPILKALKDAGVPSIHFGTGTSTLLKVMREAGGDVIGLDWRIPLDMGWAEIGYDRAVQGNLDPVTLLSTEEVIEAHTRDILKRAGGRPGHIFNLGHGIIRQTDPSKVKFLVDRVHALSRK